MKAFISIVILLLVVAAIFIFTKPSDDDCKAKAKTIVDAVVLSKTPGYQNPMDAQQGTAAPESILVKDKVLYKEVDYVGKGDVKTIGYAYLGSFHASKSQEVKK
ncbi:MAG: hypothetical protein ACR2FN_10235 [Chitinophagaceae bacterium]